MDPMISTLVQSAGPIGFGLAALIVIWRVIVAPELAEARRTRHNEAKAIIDALVQIVKTNHQTAKINERIAEMLTSRTEDSTDAHGKPDNSR